MALTVSVGRPPAGGTGTPTGMAGRRRRSGLDSVQWQREGLPELLGTAGAHQRLERRPLRLRWQGQTSVFPGFPGGTPPGGDPGMKSRFKHMGFTLTRRDIRLDFKVPAENWTDAHEAAMIEHGSALFAALIRIDKAL